MSAGGRLRAMAVVVPAHDEAALIDRCLASLTTAAGRVRGPGLRVLVVVVLDACADDTGARARRRLRGADAAIVVVRARNVGVARAVGFGRALRLLGDVDAERLWLATTDADTTVPDTWLERQATLADRGWDALAGTVRVGDWEDRPARAAGRFDALVTATASSDGHPHVHGANLGMTAATYLEAGGMPRRLLAEDHGMWAAIRATGRPALASASFPVTTSARRRTRAPDGFGAFLDRL